MKRKTERIQGRNGNEKTERNEWDEQYQQQQRQRKVSNSDADVCTGQDSVSAAGLSLQIMDNDNKRECGGSQTVRFNGNWNGFVYACIVVVLFMPFSLMATLLCCCRLLFTISPLSKRFLILHRHPSFLFFLSLSLSRFPLSIEQPYILALDWRSFLINPASSHPHTQLIHLHTSRSPHNTFFNPHNTLLAWPYPPLHRLVPSWPSFLPSFTSTPSASHKHTVKNTRPEPTPSFSFVRTWYKVPTTNKHLITGTIISNAHFCLTSLFPFSFLFLSLSAG